ncbi:uncharacterized protein LOC119599562 [Lucilia sericata]|uniref:uncharacterized protein LOC119599562 n=1 Tax=Lucilia sericata TaxID=13632 RepID=UPI0018A82320|nr:uncharacterized protein LOC119599562 [Lucilia sericata]
MKTTLILAFILVLLSYTQGDTKVIRKINISNDDSYREETFSLKNENTSEEELVIEGTNTQKLYAKDSNNFVYRLETTYVADKDGYRAKYKLIRVPLIELLLLGPSTLKSLAG